MLGGHTLIRLTSPSLQEQKGLCNRPNERCSVSCNLPAGKLHLERKALRLLRKKKRALGCGVLLAGGAGGRGAQKGHLLQAGLLLNKRNPAFFPIRAFGQLNTPGGGRLDIPEEHYRRSSILTRATCPRPLLPGEWVPIVHRDGVTTVPSLQGPGSNFGTLRDIHSPQILPRHLTVAGGPLSRLPGQGLCRGLHVHGIHSGDPIRFSRPQPCQVPFPSRSQTARTQRPCPAGSHRPRTSQAPNRRRVLLSPFPRSHSSCRPQSPLRAVSPPPLGATTPPVPRRGESGTSLTAVTWGSLAGRAHLRLKEGSRASVAAGALLWVLGGSWVVLAWPPPRSSSQAASGLKAPGNRAQAPVLCST